MVVILSAEFYRLIYQCFLKYIQCCSSTSGPVVVVYRRQYLNTSNVVVRLTFYFAGKYYEFKFKYIQCCSSTKTLNIIIHFSSPFKYIQCCSSTPIQFYKIVTCIKFKYIQCCSSTSASTRSSLVIPHLNTSNVVVRRKMLRKYC